MPIGQLIADDDERRARHTDDTRAKVPVLLDDADELSVRLGASAVRVNVDGERLGDTNGVGELDKDTAGETSSDKRLGDPAASVGTGAVDLGPVLAREGTTTVGTPATVRVNDDLAACQQTISARMERQHLMRGAYQ